MDELRAQAQHARQRYDLYKARVYGQRPTSPARLLELERECTRAEAVLRFGLQERDRAGRPSEAAASSDHEASPGGAQAGTRADDA